MAIQAPTVKHVANLARLSLSPEEVEATTHQLSRILDLMKQLGDLPTGGVRAMSHPLALEIPQREDRVVNGDNRSALLANAPDADQGHFRVPKIIE